MKGDPCAKRICGRIFHEQKNGRDAPWRFLRVECCCSAASLCCRHKRIRRKPRRRRTYERTIQNSIIEFRCATGRKLFTSVYVPKDTSKPYPILMNRTPYSVGPYGINEYDRNLGPSEEFEKEGYIFVYQDVRGRFLSEGTFLEMNPHIDNKKSAKDVDESTDTYDTIEFLLKNVLNNNGKVGIWGISYPGFYVSASIIDSHPALKAASPQAPMTDLFMGDDTFHGGAFMLAANFDFYTDFVQQTEPTLRQRNTRLSSLERRMAMNSSCAREASAT